MTRGRNPERGPAVGPLLTMAVRSNTQPKGHMKRTVPRITFADYRTEGARLLEAAGDLCEAHDLVVDWWVTRQSYSFEIEVLLDEARTADPDGVLDDIHQAILQVQKAITTGAEA